MGEYLDPPVGVSNGLPHTTYRLPERAPRQEGPGIMNRFDLQHQQTRNAWTTVKYSFLASESRLAALAAEDNSGRVAAHTPLTHLSSVSRLTRSS